MSFAETLIERIGRTQTVAQIKSLLTTENRVCVKGAAGSLKAILLADLFQHFSAQFIYFCADSGYLEGVRDDLQILLGENNVAYFPASDVFGFGLDLANDSVRGERLRTLQTLAEKQPKIIIAHSSALLQKLPASKNFYNARLSIEIDKGMDFEGLIESMIDLGFTREHRVEQRGQMSVRGGIIDLFPFSCQFPYRVEFFGEQVESIRRFDPVTQRSLKEVKGVDVFPQELTPPENEDVHTNVLAYFDNDAIVFLDEPDLIQKNLETTIRASSDLDLQNGEQIFGADLDHSMNDFKRLHFVSLSNKHQNLINLGATSQESLKGNLKLFKEAINRLNEKKLSRKDQVPTIFFLCDGEVHTQRTEDIFADEEIVFANLAVHPLGLSKGFTFPEANLVVFSENEFYGRTRRLRLPKKAFQGLTPKKLKQLNIGDYVAHVDYGIGIFRGLKKIDVQGHERECLHLEYRDKDKVYVRIERMDRVNKYSPKEGATPILSKLGSPEWHRLKARTKKKIKDMAKELIEIYAKRKAQFGFTFADDTLWQRELEASFPYEDTPDQMKATVEVKKDMENPKPMDRLVCGDVGFGKTEIAVRAAFKSVLSGKQVAMLVPTTILAHQHYNTFIERLENFPVNVEMLSRFRTNAEQKKIVEKIKTGDIDIVIGTHRLLSKDIHFKDLGLIIIDEEQRFGVRHKERLKKFRATVDVLTLTATPIPRTLQFALMGARDMTNINTPPRNRQPIVTEILTLNKQYIREVILRELDRSGQVFFVHNRVRTIERIAAMLSDLVPEAQIAIAHGQMNERELEKVIIDFMRNKYDILVSTMIIESGMDMPNVNTIIVNRADKLGLAQLYQLRGRVGRSHQRAYAYLLIPSLDSLTDEALKRLRALEEFTELGSGSQLAMRDLEIRGAGNLLGAEQSGFVDVLGFDLYNKVLDEAVQELKKEKLPDEPQKVEVETQVEIDCDAFLPDDYVQSSSERVDIYRRLTESTSNSELEDIRSELQDRFGRLPEPIDNLINYMAIRNIGKQLGLKSIAVKEQTMIAEFAPEAVSFNGEHFKKWLGSMLENAAQPFEFFQNDGFGIKLNLDRNHSNVLSHVKEFVASLTKPASFDKSSKNEHDIVPT